MREVISHTPDLGEKDVKDLLDGAHDFGIDLIFPCVRCHDNRVAYKSRIEASYYGWDVLQALCDGAHERGMEIHPWFCFWGDARNTHPELHVKSRFGPQKGRWPWLCPARPESQQYFLEMVREILEHYEVDGIHLDYIRYLDEPCYCEYHRQQFKERFDADPLELEAGSELWIQWCEYNVGTISSFVQRIAEEARKRGKKLSAAVFKDVDRHDDESGNPFYFDRIGQWDGWQDAPNKEYAVFQRWSDWCCQGYLDYICPMNYMGDAELFESALRRELDKAGCVPLFSGVALFDKFPFEALIKEIQLSMAIATGVCFFDLIRLLRMGEEKKGRIRKTLTFGGQLCY